MTITRNGIEIKLTDDEIRSAARESHIADLRYEIETALHIEEEEGTVSFSTRAECGFADYSSESDARSDFVENLVSDYTEQEEMYDRDPSSIYGHNFTDDVLALADDFGYLQKAE